MKTTLRKIHMGVLSFLVFFALIRVSGAGAVVQGTEGDTTTPGSTLFSLTARSAHIKTGEGGNYLAWGYAEGTGEMQYPGPTLIVQQGQTVVVDLSNALAENVSIVFPGQTDVTTTGGVAGLLTAEAPPGGSVTYRFTASEPGTYIYHSGTDPELQVEMGLVGALVIRPATPNQAYNDPATAFGHEYLYVLSEMNANVHQLVELGLRDRIGTSNYLPHYWFINGRTGPDTLRDPNIPLLPHQPYDALARMHPGDKVLLRLVGAGRHHHPFHTHGNNFDLIARDGRQLSAPLSDFTQTVAPGATYDVIFTWDGRELGWDYYGHSFDRKVCSDDDKVECRTSADCVSPVATCDPDPKYFPEVAEMVETTLAAPFSGAGAPVTVDFASAAGLPTTHGFRAVIWDGSALPACTPTCSPNEDTGREVLTVKFNATTSLFEATVRGAEGTTANSKAWPAGSRIAMTDHGKTFDNGVTNPGSTLPVDLPDQKDLTLGAMWPGSPFLGDKGDLPPGEGGFNLNNGFFFIWHSHTEKELINFDIFPGGMLTFLIVEPHGVTIP